MGGGSSLLLYFYDFPLKAPGIQTSWVPFSFRTASQGTFSARLLRKPKSALQRAKLCWSHTLLLQELQIMSTPRSPLTTTSPQSPSLLTNNRFNRTPFWILQKLCKESIFHTLQQPPRSSSVLSVCISSRHVVSWSPSWQQKPLNVRLLLAVCRLFHPPLHPG